MVTTSSAVSMESFAGAVRSTALGCVRVPDPAALVHGVVIHGPGDPAPEPGMVMLCAGLEDELPGCVAVVLRESDLSVALPRLAEEAAVFTVPEGVRWSDVYDRLQVVLGESCGPQVDSDAFHLADTLAISLGGAVTIEDVDRRVIAFSAVPGQWIDDVRREGILGRKVPEHLERDEWYARLWRSPGVVEFGAGAESTARVAIAVRVGGQPVGSVWVVGSRDTLSPDAESTLESTTTVVATCLANQDQSAARSRDSRGKALGQLLSAANSDQAMGYSLPGPTILVGVMRAGQSEDPELLDARLADVLSMHAQRFQGAGLAAALEGKVYALLPSQERTQFENQLRSALARAGLSQGHVAVSGVSLAQALPQARQHVDRLLRLREGNPVSGVEVLHVDDLLSGLWLAEVADAIRGSEAMTSGVLKQMAEHDLTHGTDYVPSLRAWFDACGDTPAAAAKLHIHPNTFRYRLARASDIFGLRMDDPDERLLLHLQLRLGELA